MSSLIYMQMHIEQWFVLLSLLLLSVRLLQDRLRYSRFHPHRTRLLM